MAFASKKNVVVPIDFSGQSKIAIETALEVVDSPENLHVVHVLFPLDAVSPGVVWGELDDKKREESALEHAKQFLSDSNLPSTVKVLVRIGDPGTEIAEYAESVKSELIVVPSHGYHGLKRIFLGSVAERIIRHANCAVLVLRRSDAD